MSDNVKTANKKIQNMGGAAFVPFLVLIGLVLGNILFNTVTGAPQAGNGLPILAVTLVAVVFSFFWGKGGSVEGRVQTFSKSMGDPTVQMMVVIFLLAGSFTSVSKAMGGVDSVVNLCLSFLPKNMIYMGIMLITGFIAVSIGTSVGSVTAMAPIAVGLVEQAGLSVNIALAACVAGAMFGDNLSMVSDTTIAATRGLGCEMKDKFKMNFLMVLPAAILALVIYAALGMSGSGGAIEVGAYNIIKILPYIFVLIAALCGLNIMTVLLSGIVLSGVIGFAMGELTFRSFMGAIGSGMSGMTTVILTSLLVKGLMGIIAENGGVDWLIQKLTGNLKSAKGAQASICVLSFCMSVLLRSTSAIVVSAPLAKDIGDQYDIDPRRTASLLDIFATSANGFVFWEGLILTVTQLTGVGDPISIVGFAIYPILIILSVAISIIFNIQPGKKRAAAGK